MKKKLYLLVIFLVLSILKIAAQTPLMKSLRVGKQIWTKENLNIPAKNAHYYQFDSISNYKFGLLYNWHDAQKICPNGWHLPSKKEFQELLNYYHEDYNKFINPVYFSGKLGGYGYYFGDTFGNIEYQGYYWSRTTINGNGAWCLKLEKKTKTVKLIDFPQDMEFSVKCIKD